MKRKSKLPTNLSPQLKNVLTAAKNVHETLYDIEKAGLAYREQLKLYQSLVPSEEVSECLIQVEAILLELPERKLALDKILEKFCLPPLKPKPAKRTASTLSK